MTKLDLRSVANVVAIGSAIGLVILIVVVPPMGWFPPVDDAEWAQDQSERTVTMTYYVENSTNMNEIHGPRNMSIDGQEIHIRFEPCQNYTFVNDEPHPCQ